MLHLIPAPAHRFLLRVAHRLRRLWWRLRKPRLSGCRVLAIDSEERVLLVRHSYGSGHWMPPGGGMGRNEDALSAARRELLEETGCRLEWALRVEHAVEQLHGAGNEVHVIAGLTLDVPLADGREIVAAEFFHLHALPEQMPRLMRSQLPGWVRAATAGRRRDAVESPDPPAPRE